MCIPMQCVGNGRIEGSYNKTTFFINEKVKHTTSFLFTTGCSSAYNTRLSFTTGNTMSSSTATIETILSSSSTRWSSVRRYVERNMEPHENYPQLKKIVQDKIEKKFLDAFSETRGNVHIINWDELPLILSSQIIDSLNRYTKRNMERHEIENNPQLKKLVQAEIGKQLDVAIRDGTLQSKKWDGTLVSHLGYKNWDNERLIYSEREPDHEELNDGLITNDLGTCIICLHDQRTTAFGPCGHIWRMSILWWRVSLETKSLSTL